MDELHDISSNKNSVPFIQEFCDTLHAFIQFSCHSFLMELDYKYSHL